MFNGLQKLGVQNAIQNNHCSSYWRGRSSYRIIINVDKKLSTAIVHYYGWKWSILPYHASSTTVHVRNETEDSELQRRNTQTCSSHWPQQ